MGTTKKNELKNNISQQPCTGQYNFFAEAIQRPYGGFGGRVYHTFAWALSLKDTGTNKMHLADFVI